MKKTKTQATLLRTGLVILIIIFIGLTTTGFYFAQKYLHDFSLTVSQAISKSTINVVSSQGISDLKQALDEKQSTIDKLDSLMIIEKDYQSQAINDLNKYAADNGLTITDSKVSNPTDSGSIVLGSSVGNIKYVAITLQNPVAEAGFVKFLKSIENNLPKMQITSITIKKNVSPSGTVNVDPITIGVYTK